MHFSTNAAPALTPLGVRLLSVSRHKLERLEPSIGGRDSNDLLRRGVLVREALRSAWATIDSPASELTDWRAPDALGLSVLSEEDEDEEMAEERWLDEQLSDIEEEAWAETTVSTPMADDADEVCCDYEEFEIAHIESVELDDNYDVVVQVAAVEDDDDDEDAVLTTAWREMPRKASAGVVFCDELPELTHAAVDVPTPAPASVAKTVAPDTLCDALSQLTPRAECDEAELPALQGCTDEDDEDDEDVCRTPPLLSCEDLEEISEEDLWRRPTADAKGEADDWRIHAPSTPVVLLPG